MIRDPDLLLAIISQMKGQFASQLAELNDSLACAIVQRDARVKELEAEVARLRQPVSE